MTLDVVSEPTRAEDVGPAAASGETDGRQGREAHEGYETRACFEQAVAPLIDTWGPRSKVYRRDPNSRQSASDRKVNNSRTAVCCATASTARAR